MSKGSRSRKPTIGQEELANRYDLIFGKKLPKEPYVPPPLPLELQKPSSYERQLGKNVPSANT